MTNWLIYKHTNLINGKVYIGQTCKKPKYRWNSGRGYLKADTHFARAINFYGWDNFSHEIIEEKIESKEKANEREMFWIKFYDSFKNGYNSTYGGDNADHLGKEIYKINKSDLSIAEKFISISDACRKNPYNEGNIGRCCRYEGTEAYGFYWCFAEDYLSFKPREYQLNYVAVLQLDKNDYHIIRRFRSLKDAAESIKTNHSNIMNVCQRRNTYCMGFCWCYEKDYHAGWFPKERLHGEHGHKQIVCFETRKVYKSESEAAREFSTSTGNILNCLKNKQCTIRGFHFVRIDEYDDNYLPPLKITNKRKIYCLEAKKVYESATECSMELNVPLSQIIGVCNKYQTTARNYHFCYLEDKDKTVFIEGKSKKIICIETGVIYESNKDAYAKTKIKHITECCRGQAISAGGYHWCYLKDRDNFVVKNNKSIKSVRCIETGEIFVRSKDACEKYNINVSCLSECLKGRQKTAGGYHWEYADGNAEK